jgi:hypothetical protein
MMATVTESVGDQRTDGPAALPVDAAAFVEHFRTIWAEPRRHLDTFLDFVAPEIRLTAPIVGTTVGREAGLRAFRDAFRVLPDLRGRVDAWACREDRLYIDMEFTATIGGRAVSWANVDRFRFENGAAVERCAFFDPLVLLPAFLRRPSGWLQLWSLARQRRDPR